MVTDNYINEIHCRDMLEKKYITTGIKLTEEEKRWLDTHKKYSSILGYPILMQDVIELDADKKYQFRVVFMNSARQLLIAPCFIVPALEGSITTDRELYNSAGKKSKAKVVKMLVTEIDRENPEFFFQYQSTTGALQVSFLCEYEDRFQHIRIRRFSHHFEGLYMIRKDIEKNQVMYLCRAKDAEEFDSLSFLLEWNTM